MKNLTVLIADDHRDFRRVVHAFLNKLPNVSVVGEANDGSEAIEQVEKLFPDVVLMDVAMPRMNGIDATRIIKKRWPATKIYIATSHDDPLYRLQAIDAKADGFILKSAIKPSLEATFCISASANMQVPVEISYPEK
jgi:DNA-binding NarL/FixJ family response regulator